MERRVLLAIFLAFLVLYTWQALFVKPVPKPISGTAPATTSASSAATGAQTAANSTATSEAPAATAPKLAAPLAPAAQLQAQKWKCETGKIRTPTGTSDDDIGIVSGHFELLDRFLSHDGLVQKNVVEH
jgi:hypothetical protein